MLDRVDINPYMLTKPPKSSMGHCAPLQSLIYMLQKMPSLASIIKIILHTVAQKGF